MNALKSSPHKLDWINVVFLLFVHVAAIGGTVLYLAFHGLTPAALILAGLWTLACGFSVTAGYHRLFAHGTYRAHPLLRAFFLIFGAAAFENSALKWAADHRRHHRYVDEEADPYSIRKGFWWAHIGWVLMRDPPGLPPSPVGDLERDPLVRLQRRFYVPVAVAAGFLLPTAIGWLLGDAWGALVLAGFVRLVILYHSTFCVNSLAHTIGSQPYSDANSARDSAITALVTLGEGYHNFHHTFPFDYRNGVQAAHFDPTKWLIRGLSYAGLTRDLVRVPHDAVVRARLHLQERRASARLKGQPQLGERLRAFRERVEGLLDRWAQLKRQFAERRERSGAASREALAALAAKIRDARAQFREAYRAWFRALRQPELLLASS